MSQLLEAYTDFLGGTHLPRLAYFLQDPNLDKMCPNEAQCSVDSRPLHPPSPQQALLSPLDFVSMSPPETVNDGWQCSIRIVPCQKLAFYHARHFGALVGGVSRAAPLDWPELHQEQAKFKDIPSIPQGL